METDTEVDKTEVMTQNVAPNHVSELTKPQEKILKQVWTYLFHFWGIQVHGEKAFEKGPSVALTEKNTSVTGKKKKSFFNKLQSSYYGSDGDEKDSEPEESVYTLNMIHDCLKDIEPESTKEEFWGMLRLESPDSVLLKFIRARKYNTDKAMSMIAHSMHWRVGETKVDEILCGGERAAYENNENGIIKNLELQKAIISGQDKQGRPIILARPRLHYAHDQTEKEMEKYCLLVIEQARLFFRNQVDTATILFDLTGFSMSNMDYSPVKFLITCFEAHYPESLGHMFIHKAPWIFPPIWNIIKNWLDPVVVSKILFTKNAKDLSQYIDMEQLPEYLGGSNDIETDHFVKPDGSQDTKLQEQESAEKIKAKRNDLVQKFVDATVKWIETDSEEESNNYLQLKMELSEQLSENYSELDPYIRSRSVYDINGLLKV